MFFIDNHYHFFFMYITHYQTPEQVICALYAIQREYFSPFVLERVCTDTWQHGTAHGSSYIHQACVYLMC